MDRVGTLLLLPGALTVTPEIVRVIEKVDRVIAVDGGIIQAERLSITPDLWVGDFDSTSEKLLHSYADIPKLQYPRDKSLLDTEIALEEAKKAGSSRVILFGGMGGRLDHQMALLMLPLHYREFDFIYTDGEHWLFTAERELRCYRAERGQTVSLIPLEEMRGVTFQGVKWPLDKANLAAGMGLTISNEVISACLLRAESGRGWLSLTPFKREEKESNMWILFHNDNCSKSRAAHQYLTDLGVEFEVINYLETPPTVAELENILQKLSLKIDDIIRRNEAPFELVEGHWETLDEGQKIAYVATHPILIQRPIIVNGDRAVIGRPLEAIDQLRD